MNLFYNRPDLQERQKSLLERFKSHVRLEHAVAGWLNQRGFVSTAFYAELYSVNHNLLTIKIQEKLSEMSGVPMQDNAPKITVWNTKEDLDRTYPAKSYFGNPAHSLELFYYLANPQLNQRHEESLYRGTDF